MRLPLRSLPLLLLAALAAGACDDGTGPRPGPPATLAIVSGSPQAAPAGTELPQPLVVRVSDAAGRTIEGQRVVFQFTGTDRTRDVEAVTDDDGLAQARLRLGSAAGPQPVEVRVLHNDTGALLLTATASFTATAGAPTQVAALNGDAAVVAIVGSMVEDSFAVVVRDANNNPVPGATVAWTVGSGGGTIVPATQTDAQGIARTEWVLGPSTASQTARATVAGTTVTFTAAVVTSFEKYLGDGRTGAAGMPILVSVLSRGPAGELAGLPVRWQVTSGGGSVSPAFSRTTTTGGETQWTLGPPGPQTLTATSGGYTLAFTATSVGAGTRTLLAQVPGRVLDVSADRLVWLDSAGGPRLIKLRTLPGGADVVIKQDTVPATGRTALEARRFDGGALVWGSGRNVFEWRGGTLSLMGPFQGIPEVDGPWATWATETQVVRRDLAAGTSLVIPVTGSPLGVSSDVGPNGDLVYVEGNVMRRYRSGITTVLPTESGFGSLADVLTDGVNVVYTTFQQSVANYWISLPGGSEFLAGANGRAGGSVPLRLAGGWTAYSESGPACTGCPAPADSVVRRAPDATRQVLAAGNPAILQALSSDGAVVYSMGDQYFLSTAAGATSGLGAKAPGDTVDWRHGRFLLFSGGSAYSLSP